MRILALFSCLLLILVLLFIKPHVFVRAEGTTVILPKTAFYIASSPTKVYKFDPHPLQLSQIVEKYTYDSKATFGIYVKNISTGQEYTLNADESFPSASLYKLAVMYTIYKKADEGKIKMDQKIEDNLKAMITVSSNEAAYYLVNNYTSWKEVTEYIHDLGLNNTSLSQDPPVTTPADMGKLLDLMAEGKTVNLEDSVSMLELMLAQTKNDRIPVHLPPNALVAHKTGELGEVRHDAGVIVTPENNFILVLMSKSDNPEAVKPIMANISSEIYNFFSSQWANPPEIL